MDETTLMHVAERARKRDRDAKEIRYVQWSAKKSIGRRTAVMVCQCDRSRRPVSVKFFLERILVFQPLGRVFFCSHEQNRRQAVAGAPVKSDVSIPQRRECVARKRVHRGLL